MPGIRSFIAIEMPPGTRQELDAVEKQLQERLGQAARRAVRWVPAGNIHLTLKFLGDVSPQQMPALTALLQEEVARHPALDLVVAGLGVFPNPRRPRVVWVGCDGGAALASLARAVDQRVSTQGFPREDRPFSAHLTLGRVSDHAREEELAVLARAMAEANVGELARVRVESIHLFRSDLRPAGPVYTSLQRFALGGVG